MKAMDVIVRKRDGGELRRGEIDLFIQGYTQGEIPDYQASAWAMAVQLKGMTRQETIDLTLSMAASGETFDLYGDVLLTIHANDETQYAVAREQMLAAYSWAEGAVIAPPLVYEVIE